MKNKIKQFLGIKELEYRIETLENLLLDKEAKIQGFACLKGDLVGHFVQLDKEGEPIVLYCNEKEYTGTGFLFKCGEGCVHNTIKDEQCACGKEWKHTGDHNEPQMG